MSFISTAEKFPKKKRFTQSGTWYNPNGADGICFVRVKCQGGGESGMRDGSGNNVAGGNSSFGDYATARGGSGSSATGFNTPSDVIGHEVQKTHGGNFSTLEVQRSVTRGGSNRIDNLRFNDSFGNSPIPPYGRGGYAMGNGVNSGYGGNSGEYIEWSGYVLGDQTVIVGAGGVYAAYNDLNGVGGCVEVEWEATQEIEITNILTEFNSLESFNSSNFGLITSTTASELNGVLQLTAPISCGFLESNTNYFTDLFLFAEMKIPLGLEFFAGSGSDKEFSIFGTGNFEVYKIFYKGKSSSFIFRTGSSVNPIMEIKNFRISEYQ